MTLNGDTNEDDIKSKIKDIVLEIRQEEIATNDVDAEDSESFSMSMLSTRASNIEIINKLNEVIDSLNKSLRDYRI